MLSDEYVILTRLYLLQGERLEAEKYAHAALQVLWDHGFLGTEWSDEWGLEWLLRTFNDVQAQTQGQK